MVLLTPIRDKKKLPKAYLVETLTSRIRREEQDWPELLLWHYSASRDGETPQPHPKAYTPKLYTLNPDPHNPQTMKP